MGKRRRSWPIGGQLSIVARLNSTRFGKRSFGTREQPVALQSHRAAARHRRPAGVIMPLTDADLDRDFGRIWPVHVEAFTRLLIVLREELDGDLDKALLLGAIGDRTLPRDRVPGGLDYDSFMLNRKVEIEPRPINLYSLSAYTGIPRETARRKIDALVSRGLVSKSPDGYLIASRQASRQLERATRATLAYFKTIAPVLQARQSAREPA
jgi:hypothetical protein